jgi:hypothetical protein
MANTSKSKGDGAKASKSREPERERKVKASPAAGTNGTGNGNGHTGPSYTFITNGFRAHPDPDDGLPIATLKGAKWKDQESLQKVWKEQVQAIKDKDYVIGGGDPGIFSMRFTKQVAQITALDQVWCYSTGLGMVNLAARYPQYDLVEYDASIKNALEPGEISERAWWAFVCELSGNSITSVIKDAIEAKKRVLIALPPLQYTIFRDDLKRALDEIGRAEMCEHVRILGPELEGLLTPKLLPCLMPYDREALDRLVPGNRSHGIRRLARLFRDVCPPDDKGGANPVDDYKALVEAFEDQDREPIVYDTGSVEKVTKLRRLQGDELKAKVMEYADVCGPIAQRIMRMMREDGIGMSTEVIQDILDKSSSAKPEREAREPRESREGRARRE